MYVFSIDIPFKGSQSLAKITSKVTAVSYLHSRVIDSAVHVTAESMTPLGMPGSQKTNQDLNEFFAKGKGTHISLPVASTLAIGLLNQPFP
jgi:hypothetical protein